MDWPDFVLAPEYGQTRGSENSRFKPENCFSMAQNREEDRRRRSGENLNESFWSAIRPSENGLHRICS